MSQASNHVNWCLKKAQKEIGECNKVGRKKKHRGLLKIEPNKELAKKHIEKAEHNLKAIKYLLKGNYSDTSISMIFYSMYHCMLAIVVNFGYESRNQTCTIALIEFLKEEGEINLDNKYVNLLKYAEAGESVIDLREEFTYGIEVSSQDKSKIDEMIKDCMQLIDLTKQIIY